jgi:hypothetical protein
MAQSSGSARVYSIERTRPRTEHNADVPAEQIGTVSPSLGPTESQHEALRKLVDKAAQSTLDELLGDDEEVCIRISRRVGEVIVVEP